MILDARLLSFFKELFILPVLYASMSGIFNIRDGSARTHYVQRKLAESYTNWVHYDEKIHVALENSFR